VATNATQTAAIATTMRALVIIPSFNLTFTMKASSIHADTTPA